VLWVPELPPELVLPEGFARPSLGSTAAGPPVQPKDAATVMLVRDAVQGIEVFLQRRVKGMPFAGGMTVFPGGGVDPRDAHEVPWAGPAPSWWAQRFGVTQELARALVCAAVRETFEESGVLLAGPSGGSVVSDASVYREGRAALVAREVSMAAFLAGAGLVLRADLLRPWANWLTPEGEPRRYDTRFLLAALPDGQRADAVTSEAVDASWQSPAAALADWRAGKHRLLPPTWYTLAELAEHPGVSALLDAAERRTIEKIMPRVIRDGDALRVVLPGDPRYDGAANQLDP
jgi:8-oxo-dGTP pyrophosphatase MutT (NUDIX family)